MTSALNGIMISGNTITLSSDLLFDSGKDELKPEGLRILSVICNVIKNTYPDRPVIIEGHTDNVPIKPSGKFRDNNDLSLARAEAVWLYFINHGLSQANLYAQGFGESNPIASNSAEDGKRQNRRVVIKVVPIK
jgi:chemotaxis protein MotB